MTTVTGSATFPYHHQIFQNFCGPACAHMILDSLSVPGLTQTDIAVAGESTTPSQVWAQDYIGWVSRPDEIMDMINNLAPRVARTFDRRTAPNTKQFRKLLKNLVEDLTIKPPATPIHGNSSHWVVFFQYHVNSGRKSFHGHDPYYLDDDDGTPPTAPITINVPDQDRNFRPPLNHIAIAQANSAIALPIRRDTETGTETPLADSEAPMTSEEDDNIPRTEGLPESAIYKGLPTQIIQKKVIEELRSYGVIAPDGPDDTLVGFSPGDPLLVRTPDAPGESYYIIGLNNLEKQNRILARMDAAAAQYLDSIKIPPTVYLLGKSTIESKIFKRVHNQLVNKMKKESWFRAFEAELSRTNQDGIPQPNLIWKPCNESLSPFYPFYEVKVRRTVFYVRIDGSVFLKLTPLKGLSIRPVSKGREGRGGVQRRGTKN